MKADKHTFGGSLRENSSVIYNGSSRYALYDSLRLLGGIHCHLLNANGKG